MCHHTESPKRGRGVSGAACSSLVWQTGRASVGGDQGKRDEAATGVSGGAATAHRPCRSEPPTNGASNSTSLASSCTPTTCAGRQGLEARASRVCCSDRGYAGARGLWHPGRAPAPAPHHLAGQAHHALPMREGRRRRAPLRPSSRGRHRAAERGAARRQPAPPQVVSVRAGPRRAARAERGRAAAAQAGHAVAQLHRTARQRRHHLPPRPGQRGVLRGQRPRARARRASWAIALLGCAHKPGGQHIGLAFAGKARAAPFQTASCAVRAGRAGGRSPRAAIPRAAAAERAAHFHTASCAVRAGGAAGGRPPRAATLRAAAAARAVPFTLQAKS
jgi:hypothetical protein